MLKRITCTLGLLGLSFAAFAGMPGNNMVPPSGVVLNAPDSGSGWSVGIEGLYVQPTGNNYQYSQVNNGAALQNQSVDNSYQWGGEADATYHFKGNSRDVNFGYTHLDEDESDTTHLNSGETFEQTVAVSPDSAKGETDNDYNAVDLT
ncbi:MAG: Lpg1974 family pore-forming outer membrane protein, partial [Gammaproteobacteria bacterium]